MPSASTETLGEAGDHAPVFPGTYTTHFQPPLTLTVGDEVSLDCAPGFTCRGYVNANSDGWLDLDFGVSRQAELMLIRLDKVYDPASPSKLIDAPADLAAWLQASAGTVVFEPPTAVSIGGMAATQFDVRTGGEAQFGLIAGGYGQAGIGPSALRVILVRVHDHLVLITEWFGEKNTVRDRHATVAWLQPIIDSIVWL